MTIDAIEPALSAVLREPTCLVGVGNPLRRDDGAGPWIVGAVREAVAGTGLCAVDAQDVPENFVPGIARGDFRNVVFIDVVAAEGPPGPSSSGPWAISAKPRASRPTSSDSLSAEVPRSCRKEGSYSASSLPTSISAKG